MKYREFRLKFGLTEQELADKMGITKQYISEIERGLRDPSVKILIHLSWIFDTCPCVLLNFKCTRCN